MPRTRDGFRWTLEGVSTGLGTEAVIPSRIHNSGETYDVIVIGAGFTGLTAARDLSQLHGMKVLVIEGRDRIGGRAWTAKVNGEDFEIGGNWVHWFQPSIWNELVRYGLDREIRVTAGATEEELPASTSKSDRPDGRPACNSIQWIADAFFNVDGYTARTLLPYPYDPARTHDSAQSPPPWRNYEHLSVRDRLNQMTEVSDADKEKLESIIPETSLVTSEKCGFTHFLKWYAIGGFNLRGLSEVTEWYKLGPGGMTKLAKHVFSDFEGDIIFDRTVKAVDLEDEKLVKIRYHDRTSERFREITAKGLVSTVPLRHFHAGPPRSEDESHSGWACQFRLEDTRQLSEAEKPWFKGCRIDPQNVPWINAVHDRNSGEASYAIAFGWAGALPNPTIDASKAADVVGLFEKEFSRQGSSARVQETFTHDWANDVFSRGAWITCPPGLQREILDNLTKPFANGRVILANSDWAEGGYSFVDGAIEQGKKAATHFGNFLRD